MNVDGSSLLSLFSTTESLEGFNQTLQLDGEVTQEFSSVLIQKLAQLNNLELDENFSLNFSDNESTLHGLADLLNEKNNMTDFSSFFGKNLPVVDKLESDVSLEDTLHALENVINTLGEVELEDIDLENGLIDKSSLDETLDSLFSPSWTKTAEIVSEKKRILVEQLQIEIQSKKTSEQKDELLIVSQMAAIVATLDEKPLETEIKTSLVAGQVLESMNKKDSALFQQENEKSLLTVSGKGEVDVDVDVDVEQQNNSFRKIVQDLPVVTKQNEKRKIVESLELETGKTKVAPKFATDIANLNRAVMHDNKAEIPPMTKHFAHPEWNKEIGERVIWMHKQEIPSAELRLNPRHLGPVTIKIDVTQDQANISFVAQHATVKEAIEAAIPKLREMFSAQQLNLTDVNVTQDDSSQRQSKSFDQMGNGSGKGGQQRNELQGNETPEHARDIADEIEAGRAIASNGILSIFA